MIPPGREWRCLAGASPGALDRLRAASPVKLPSAYLALLAYSNGGEGPLPVQPLYFQLSPAEEVTESMRGQVFENDFPGFLMIGSNGAGEHVALDVRGRPPWPVVAIDMTNIDLEESVLSIAPNFDAFLALVGLE